MKAVRLGLIVLAVLTVIRIALPALALSYLNDKLANSMENYTGHLDDLDLSIWRGAYQLQGLVIKKKATNLEPILYIKEIDISLAWRALLKVWLKGELSADIRVYSANIRLLDSEDKKTKQLAVDESTSSWQDTLNVVIPIQIETLMIKDSSIYFVNSDLKERLPVQLDNINLSTSDLRNRPSTGDKSLSPFSAHATLQSHAPIYAKGSIDIVADPFRFDADMTIENFKVQSINKYLRLYIPLDITHSELDAYLEAASSNGNIIGESKFFLKNTDVIAHKQRYLSFKHFIYEIISAVGNWYLKNSNTKILAFRIPFEKHRDSSFKFDTSKVLRSSLDNKSRSLPKTIENKIDITKVPLN